MFLLKCSTLHFSKLSLIPHCLVHSVTATLFLCIFLTSTSLFMSDSSFESSAKSFLSHSQVSGRSLMYTTKKSGPRTVPCGTTHFFTNNNSLFAVAYSAKSKKTSSTFRPPASEEVKMSWVSSRLLKQLRLGTNPCCAGFNSLFKDSWRFSVKFL